MFLCGAIVAGILIGYLFGGRIHHLGSLKLRWVFLIPFSLFIQLLIFPLFTSRPVLVFATSSLHLLSYALVFLFLFLNARVLPLFLIGVGAILNVVVIAANGGYMPSSATALARAGAEGVVSHLLAEGVYGNVKLMGEGTRLDALGDLLYLPRWVPFATAFSVGDLVMGLGLAWLVAWGMRSHA
jgi:hypothetical protein